MIRYVREKDDSWNVIMKVLITTTLTVICHGSQPLIVFRNIIVYCLQMVGVWLGDGTGEFQRSRTTREFPDSRHETCCLSTLCLSQCGQATILHYGFFVPASPEFEFNLKALDTGL